MKIKTETNLINDILSVKFDSVYILGGTDDAKKNELLKNIRSTFKNDFDISELSGIDIDISLFMNDVSTAPLFSTKKLVILKNYEKLKKDAKKAVEDYLTNPNPSTILVITLNDELRQNELEKQFGIYSLTFINIAPPDKTEIIHYVKNELEKHSKKIDDISLEYIAGVIDNYGSLKNETEKLIIYSENKKNITFDEVKDIIASFKDLNPFDIINSILSKDRERLKKIIDDLIRSGEEPLRIINMILLALEKMIKINALNTAHINSYNLSYQLGVFPGELRSEVRYISENRIIKTINHCLDVENTLKTTHTEDPVILIKNIVYIIIDYLMNP
jgi:DNA polymerase-3 subunit delta